MEVKSIYKAPFKIEVSRALGSRFIDSMAIVDADGKDVIRYFGEYEQYTPDVDDGVTWISFMESLNALHETGKTPRKLAEENAKLRAAIKDAMDCGMIPSSSAREGGANRHVVQLQVADKIRDAMEG